MSTNSPPAADPDVGNFHSTSSTVLPSQANIFTSSVLNPTASARAQDSVSESFLNQDTVPIQEDDLSVRSALTSPELGVRPVHPLEPDPVMEQLRQLRDGMVQWNIYSIYPEFNNLRAIQRALSLDEAMLIAQLVKPNRIHQLGGNHQELNTCSLANAHPLFVENRLPVSAILPAGVSNPPEVYNGTLQQLLVYAREFQGVDLAAQLMPQPSFLAPGLSLSSVHSTPTALTSSTSVPPSLVDPHGISALRREQDNAVNDYRPLNAILQPVRAAGGGGGVKTKAPAAVVPPPPPKRSKKVPAARAVAQPKEKTSRKHIYLQNVDNSRPLPTGVRNLQTHPLLGADEDEATSLDIGYYGLIWNSIQWLWWAEHTTLEHTMWSGGFTPVFREELVTVLDSVNTLLRKVEQYTGNLALLEGHSHDTSPSLSQLDRTQRLFSQFETLLKDMDKFRLAASSTTRYQKDSDILHTMNSFAPKARRALDNIYMDYEIYRNAVADFLAPDSEEEEFDDNADDSDDDDSDADDVEDDNNDNDDRNARKSQRRTPDPNNVYQMSASHSKIYAELKQAGQSQSSESKNHSSRRQRKARHSKSRSASPDPTLHLSSLDKTDDSFRQSSLDPSILSQILFNATRKLSSNFKRDEKALEDLAKHYISELSVGAVVDLVQGLKDYLSETTADIRWSKVLSESVRRAVHRRMQELHAVGTPGVDKCPHDYQLLNMSVESVIVSLQSLVACHSKQAFVAVVKSFKFDVKPEDFKDLTKLLTRVQEVLPKLHLIFLIAGANLGLPAPSASGINPQQNLPAPSMRDGDGQDSVPALFRDVISPELADPIMQNLKGGFTTFRESINAFFSQVTEAVLDRATRELQIADSRLEYQPPSTSAASTVTTRTTKSLYHLKTGFDNIDLGHSYSDPQELYSMMSQDPTQLDVLREAEDICKYRLLEIQQVRDLCAMKQFGASGSAKPAEGRGFDGRLLQPKYASSTQYRDRNQRYPEKPNDVRSISPGDKPGTAKQPSPACYLFMANRCPFGNKCRYSHEASDVVAAVQAAFQQGTMHLDTKAAQSRSQSPSEPSAHALDGSGRGGASPLLGTALESSKEKDE